MEGVDNLNSLYMGETVKARVMFTCRHEVKEELADWAKGENRTISNLVETLVEEALAARKAKSLKTAKGKGQKEDK